MRRPVRISTPGVVAVSCREEGRLADWAFRAAAWIATEAGLRNRLHRLSDLPVMGGQYPPQIGGVKQIRGASRISICLEGRAPEMRRPTQLWGGAPGAIAVFSILEPPGGSAGAATGPLLNQRTPKPRGIKQIRRASRVNICPEGRKGGRPVEKITPGAVARFFFEPPRTLGACPWCSPIGLPALAAVAEFYARLGERSDGLAYTRWFRQVKRFRRALGGDRGPLWLFAPVAPSSACAHEVGLEALRATSKRALCNVLEQMIRAEGWLFKGHRGAGSDATPRTA